MPHAPANADVLHLTAFQRAVELSRPWILFLLYIGAATLGWWVIAVPLAFAAALSGFIQMHDAIHRSLGLSKSGNDLVLSLSGLLILKSGHGLQVTHLRHHGRCLKEDDPEGVCATWPFYRVLLEGPLHLFAMRWYAFKAGSNLRRFQVIETAITVLLVIAAVGLYYFAGSWIGIVYWVVAALLSATIPIWAAYLPHRLAPENPVIRSAGRIAQIWTPVLSSFAYHHLHHAFPKVPTVLLPMMAKTPEAAVYKAHVHH
jgi:beta-carotene hydroxylase